jgi:hypothetical protein
VLLWCALPLSPQSVDSDFWGHVQYGRDTWQYGLDRTATYTYNAIGHRWINHENLSELIFAWTSDHLGVTALLVLKCLLGCTVLALAMRHAASQGVGMLPITVTTVVVSLNLSFYWGVRPHVFTFAAFGLMVALLEWCFAGWSGAWHFPGPAAWRRPAEPPFEFSRRHALWLLPLLMAIWTNTHGGFLAGLGVAGVVLGMRAVEMFVSDRLHGRRHALLLSAIGLTTALGTLLNPYGAEFHRWLIYDLVAPRPEILEWQPTNLWTTAAWKLWLLLGLTAFGLLASRRPRDLTQCVVLAIVVQQALSHERHAPFVAILFLFWLPPHLESALQRWKNPTPVAPVAPIPPAVIRAGVVVLMLLCGLFAYRLGERFSGVPVRRDEYPVSAMQFLADQNLSGRLVVAGHWAQYVLCVRGARHPGDAGMQVAFDGRCRTCYPQLVLDLHFDFFLGEGGPDKRYRSPSSPPADPKRILEYNEPDFVLLARQHTHAQAALASVAEQWVLLYQDQLAQLWGRRAKFGMPESAHFIPPERRRVSDSPQVGFVAWPAAPRPTPTAALAQSEPVVSAID